MAFYPTNQIFITLFGMVKNQPVNFKWENGFIDFEVAKLDGFEGIVMDW